MVGASTCLTGLLPGYATIGIAAPILLVLLRIFQGIGFPIPAKLFSHSSFPILVEPRLDREFANFRHTHATLLHANGETLKTAQALLGHSDLETTLNVYTHTVSDSQRNAVERVAGVLFSDVLSSASAATPGGRPN